MGRSSHTRGEHNAAGVPESNPCYVPRNYQVDEKGQIPKTDAKLCKNGWPDKCPNTEEWHPYFIKRHELGIVEECLLWGRRVIMPIQGRKKTSTGAP